MKKGILQYVQIVPVVALFAVEAEGQTDGYDGHKHQETDGEEHQTEVRVGQG